MNPPSGFLLRAFPRPEISSPVFGQDMGRRRGIQMMDKKQEPTIAPGSDDLDKKATPREVAEGDATRVTKLSYDEVDPSRD